MYVLSASGELIGTEICSRAQGIHIHLIIVTTIKLSLKAGQELSLLVMTSFMRYIPCS
jgi:hypothetical protein